MRRTSAEGDDELGPRRRGLALPRRRDVVEGDGLGVELDVAGLHVPEERVERGLALRERLVEDAEAEQVDVAWRGDPAP